MSSIAVLLPDLRPGGAERLHVNLAHEWSRAGIRTEFVLRRRQGELQECLPGDSLVTDLRSPRVRNVLLPLVRYLKTEKPDALIAAMWPLTVIAPLAARLARFKGRVIVSEHSPLSLAYSKKGQLHEFIMRGSQRLGYPMADVRVAVSRGIADDLSRLSRLDRGGFTVIHNPAALGRVSSSVPCPAPLADVSGPVILTVGTLKPVKRHDLLIDAFSQLPESLGATLCILGEGQNRSDLERQISALGLEGKVLLPGYVADPGPWYAHANLFVLSSDYEGFGNVIVEAMEYGLPIVSTDCPVGPREILENGRYGTLVPPANATALSSGIVTALREEPQIDALKQRAKDFSLEAIAGQYLEAIFP